MPKYYKYKSSTYYSISRNRTLIVDVYSKCLNTIEGKLDDDDIECCKKVTQLEFVKALLKVTKSFGLGKVPLV